MKYSTMTLIKQLIFASLLISTLTPTSSICAAAEDWENDTKEFSEIEQPAVARGLWRARPAVANIVPVGGEMPARASNQPSPKGYGGHGHGWRGHSGNKQPIAQHVAQANMALCHALSAGDLFLARQALEDGANPDMAPDTRLLFKAKQTLLLNKYISDDDPLKYILNCTAASAVLLYGFASPIIVGRIGNSLFTDITPRQLFFIFSALPYATTLGYIGTLIDRSLDAIKAKLIQERQNCLTVGTPPLIYHDDSRIIKMLLDYQADVNMQNNHGNTALMDAISKRIRTRDNAHANQLYQKIKILGLVGAPLNLSHYNNRPYPTNSCINIFEKTQLIRQKITAQLNKLKTFLQHDEWLNPPLPITLKQIIACYLMPSSNDNDEDVRRLTEQLTFNNEHDEDINWLIEHLMRSDEHLAPLLTFSSHY